MYAVFDVAVGGGRGGYGPRPDPYNNRDVFRRPPPHNRSKLVSLITSY